MYSFFLALVIATQNSRIDSSAENSFNSVSVFILYLGLKPLTSSINVVESFDSNAQGVNFMIRTNSFFVPLNEHINVEEEVARMKADIEYYEKFLKQVNAKLSNEKFVNNAPENVVAIERKKQSDATAKIENLKKSIAALLNN